MADVEPVPLDLGKVRDSFVAAQLKGDRREAVRLVADALQRGARATDIQSAVIRAAQREIGRLWHENKIGIGDEHRATAIAQVALSHVYQESTPAPPNGKSVVVACVEGELHDLPARMVADTLELAGFRVHFLGASVPVDHIVGFVSRERPDLLALSATMSLHSAALGVVVKRVKAALGTSFPIAVGGHACEWEKTLATSLGADITADSALELVAIARARLGVTS